MELNLRKVTSDDVDLIYTWANDPEVRNNSFNSVPIPYESHCAWFAKRVSSPNVGFYVLEDTGVPVGQVRYEIDDNEALTNYSISKEYRGMGYGKAVIMLGEIQVKTDFPNIIRITAHVKKENLASAKVFRGLGYIEIGNETDFVYEKDIVQ